MLNYLKNRNFNPSYLWKQAFFKLQNAHNHLLRPKIRVWDTFQQFSGQKMNNQFCPCYHRGKNRDLNKINFWPQKHDFLLWCLYAQNDPKDSCVYVKALDYGFNIHNFDISSKNRFLVIPRFLFQKLLNLFQSSFIGFLAKMYVYELRSASAVNIIKCFAKAARSFEMLKLNEKLPSGKNGFQSPYTTFVLW